MTVTVAQVRTKVNASETALPNADIELAIGAATAHVNKYLGGPDDGSAPVPLPVPDPIYDRAILLVTVEQINQDNAPNGIANQAFTDGMGDSASTPVRIGRDPMKPAYPVLAPWVSGRFFCA